MTQRTILTSGQRYNVFAIYSRGELTVEELAKMFSCSRRTIIRVLESYGCQPTTPRQKKLAPVPAPAPVVIPTKTPWWKRIFSSTWRNYPVGYRL